MPKTWIDTKGLKVVSDGAKPVFIDGHGKQGVFTLVSRDRLPELIETLEQIVAEDAQDS